MKKEKKCKSIISKSGGHMKNKVSKLQLVLTVLSVSCLLISNIAVSKQMLLPFGIVMTCSNLVFPLTYVLSDVFSEVYGYKWSRFTCYLGFSMNLLMALVLQLSIILPYPAYWSNPSIGSVVESRPNTSANEW